jgi:BASS family bile acid:Na+ symporter
MGEFSEFVIKNEQLLARIQLVLFMMGMGATLSLADFARIVRQPRSLALGLFGQLVLASLIAFVTMILLIHILEDDVGEIDHRVLAGIATGFLLVAALPGGNMSKVFTYIGRGNIALSISMSAAATCLCLVSIPLALYLLTETGYLTAVEDIPADANLLIIQELVLFLLAPLAAGMVLVRLLPKWKDVIARWLIRSGLTIAVIMVTGSILAGRASADQYGWAVFVAILIYCLLSQQLSMLTFRLLRWPSPDIVAVGVETTMRNINLSFALVALLFPVGPGNVPNPTGNGVLFVMLVYAAIAFFAAIPLAARMRRVIRREQLRAASPTAPDATSAAPQARALVPERTVP